MTPSQARAKNRRLFEQFWAEYPKKVDKAEAERVFTDVVERGVDPAFLITRARSYANNVDPDNLRYVPSPASWLRKGKYEDNDLFTDQREAELRWLRDCWRRIDVKAVENRYHIRYRKPPLPDDIKGPEAARVWHREQAKAWIAEQAGRYR